VVNTSQKPPRVLGGHGGQRPHLSPGDLGDQKPHLSLGDLGGQRPPQILGDRNLPLEVLWQSVLDQSDSHDLSKVIGEIPVTYEDMLKSYTEEVGEQYVMTTSTTTMLLLCVEQEVTLVVCTVEVLINSPGHQRPVKFGWTSSLVGGMNELFMDVGMSGGVVTTANTLRMWELCVSCEKNPEQQQILGQPY